MRSFVRSVLVLALAAAPAAQDQATTLLHCGQSADVVVRATVLAATDPTPEFHRLRFARAELLKGDVGATFELLEPAGACCGRALFALQPGEGVLLFLRRTGVVLHPLGGARGVLADRPDVVAAVRDLLAAGDDAARATRLVAQLDHGDPRVAADAAHALATLPTLQLDAVQRDAVASALQLAALRHRTTLPPLLDAALRTADAAAIDHLLPVYLGAGRDDTAALLRRRLAGLAPTAIASRLPGLVGDDAARQLRAAELLAELPVAEGTGPLQALLTTSPCPRVKLCASRALLDAGADAAELVPFVPTPILELAERRRLEPRRFRSVRPLTQP